MEKAILTLHNQLPPGAVKTATMDRGKEFSCYPDIEAKTDIKMYFADAY